MKKVNPIPDHSALDKFVVNAEIMTIGITDNNDG